MPDDLERFVYRTNYVRRTIGVLVAGSPVLLLCTSFVRALNSGGHATTVGLVLMLAATSIGALNFYLSFIRPRLARRGESPRHVSGIPILGTVLVVAGTIVGYGAALCAAIGLLTTAIDTGGSMWFLLATWKDASLWDTPQGGNARETP